MIRVLLFAMLLSTPICAEKWRGMRRASFAGSGWERIPGGFCLVPDDEHVDLVSRAEYENFELSFSFWLAEGGNSGVKYMIDEKTGSVGYEMQLLDNDRHPDGKNGPTRQMGALYDILAPIREPNFVTNGWNEARIVADQGVYEHWINGDLVLRYTRKDEDFLAGWARSKFKNRDWYLARRRGRILLQDHGDRVCFRNINVRYR